MKRNPKYWFKNEKELMRSLGLNPTPGSGNKIIKEDGQNEHLIAQLKSTESAQVTIKLQDVNTLLYNATVTHKIPLFINQFIDGPLLITTRLQDLSEVSKYLQTGVCTNERFCDIIETDNTENKQKIKIKSGGRNEVKRKLERERQKKIEEIKNERRKRL